MTREAEEISCSSCGIFCEIIHVLDNKPAFCPFCGESIIIMEYDKMMEDQEDIFDEDEFD